jgi:hypothetical protein
VDRRAQIPFDATSQTLELYAPEAYLGIPSSATFSIWSGTSSNDSTAELTGSATVDSIDLSLNAVAGYNQTNRRSLTLSATTGLVAGRVYRLVEYVSRASSIEAHCELVTIKRVVSSTVVELEHDLGYSYTVGASNAARVMGIRMTSALTDAFCADDSNLNDLATPWRVLWTYTVGGTVRRHWTYFDLARNPSQHSVVAEDLYAQWPELRYREDPDRAGEQYRALIDEAYERVRDDLEMSGVPPQQVVEGQDRLVVLCVFSMLADVGNHPSERDAGEWARERAAIYKRYLDKAIGSGRLKQSQGSDGAITSPASRPMAFRS